MTKGTALHIALEFLFTEIPSRKGIALTLELELESLIETLRSDQLITSCRSIKISQHQKFQNRFKRITKLLENFMDEERINRLLRLFL